MAGLKVRLDDGSEVGPMDLGMVQTWFQQGLISRDTLVQKPASSRWVRLAEAVEIRNWEAPRTGVRRARGGGRAAGDEGFAGGAEGPSGRWRLFLASGFCFLGAIAAVILAFRPEHVRPELDGAPWPQIALALAALGLLLVRGWNLGRRVVRAAAWAAAAAAFPLAGIFLARGMRGEALLVLASIVLVAVGLGAFLAPRPSRLASVAALLLILLGGAGLVRFAPAEPAAIAPSEMSAWTSGERRFSAPEIGLDVNVPPGWVVLKPGHPAVAPPPTARAVFAQPRVGGYAFLQLEPPPPGVLALEHYLDHVIAQRRNSAAAYEEEGRRDVRLGAVAAREAKGRRSDRERHFLERIAVAQDGQRYLALVTWVPEAGGGRALEEIEALEAATSLSGVHDATRRAEVQRALLELPHLSSEAIDRLLDSGASASPADLFRHGAALAARGRAALSPAETQELDALTAAALAGLVWRERVSLGEFLRRAAVVGPSATEEDERMRLLMKAAVLRLEAERRVRLEELHEHAIRAALERPPSP